MRSHSDFARKCRNALEVKGQHPRTSQAENALKGAPMLVVEWGFRCACESPTRRLPNAVGSANCKFGIVLRQQSRKPCKAGLSFSTDGSKTKLTRA